MSEQRTAEEQLAEDVAGFTHDPLGHALYVYPWNEGELKDSAGPRQWQREILQGIGAHLQNPQTRHQPLLVAVASGHGIGKSALIAQLTKWAMDTCEDCKVVVTANTETQLRTKTWPEIAKWHRLAITKDWFKVYATSIAPPPPSDHEDSWRIDRITWSEHRTDAFAGLHNVGKRILVIFDEASAIADKVWEVTEGALTDEKTEIVWIAFGNPTRNSGRFRECFRKYRHRWLGRQIDSRTVEGTNKEQIQKWVDDNGEDSDFVKVRVRGIFPAQSAKQFVSEAEVDAAMGRKLEVHQYRWAPKILTLDPAWTGDDELVIGLRQGLHYQTLLTMKKNDNDVHVAQALARLEDEHQADAVFIDGGYGTGVASVGHTWNRSWQIVWFGGASDDPGCLNKRAEMWNSGKKWLREGGALDPHDQQLREDILGPETVPRVDGKIQLEAKEDMKRRGAPSPNRADAWALSFAYPVSAKFGRPGEGGVASLDPGARQERPYDEFGFGG